MGFIISILLLIILRREEIIQINDFQIILLSLISEAIFALYLIAAKFVKK